MMTIFLIHGAYGGPDENWFPWLNEELKKLGCKVVIPRFPTPEGQSLKSWMEVLNEYNVPENTIFIGHSLGVAFILNILEKEVTKAALFVSGFSDLLGNTYFDDINKSFFKEFDWNRIKNNCKNIHVFHSNDDPYVPIDYGFNISKNLACEFRIIKNSGHFNKESGYLKFEKLLDKIKEYI